MPKHIVDLIHECIKLTECITDEERKKDLSSEMEQVCETIEDTISTDILENDI